jgi:hypothetical protein
MVQVGHALDVQRRWEDLASLKQYLQHHFKTVREYIRRVSQVTTDAVVDEVEEKSGETITAIAANKVFEIWQKTDQKATDGTFTGTVEWQDINGDVTVATFALGGVGVDSTTHVPLVAAVTTARALRSYQISGLCADEFLIGNAAGTEIYGVIKVGYYQTLKTGFKVATARHGYLAKVTLDLAVASAAVVTAVVTYTPLGHVSSTTETIVLAAGQTKIEWEPCLELKAASTVAISIEDNNAAHPTAIVTAHYVEAY